MAATLKVLGQVDLTSTSLTTVYTVPGSTTTVVSTVTVANRSSTATTFRLSVAVNGAADDNKQYLAWDVSINGNETVAFTLGVSLGAADVLKAKAAAANQLTVQAFGQENT